MQNLIAGDLLFFFDTASKNREEILKYVTFGRKMSSSCAKYLESIEENVIKKIKIHIDYFPTVKKVCSSAILFSNKNLEITTLLSISW